MNKLNITLERHSHDGFTIWFTDREGFRAHRRFIGYTVREARAIVRQEVAR